MATIEPRLIHLLNNSTTPELSNADLPPFHTLPLPDTDRQLPPLDRDASQNQRGDRFAATADGTPKRLPHHHLVGEDHGSARPPPPLSLPPDEANLGLGGYAGSSDLYPLRILLRESDAVVDSSFHLGTRGSDDITITADAAGATPSDDAANKKRTRAVATSRDDYLQLPQPVKKQKPAVHASVFPPIINGLHEPPPHAALFPPIAADSFGERDSGHLKSLHSSDKRPPADDSNSKSGQKTPPETDKSQIASSSVRKRATKPRRKWSEDETNHLLLGVSKHGVGKWRAILNDPEFKFNSRSAGDLKDRFRTCCPAELRDAKGETSSPTATPSRSQQQMANPSKNKGLHSENILHQEGDSASTQPGMITPPTEAAVGPTDDSSSSKQKKTRAHRKKLADLEDLGIHAPFKKSLRRERRPFTDQDDREILEGLSKYGPAWTRILRDSSFHLLPRRPTDLRDRVRNRYPEIYQRIEKGIYQTKESGKSNDIMEPSITMCIDNSLKPPNQSSRRTGDSKEDLSSNSNGPVMQQQQQQQPSELVGCSSQPKSQGFEFMDSSAGQYLSGEMDISRLLLDDSR
ncbi:Myb-like DNA-binding domain [Geosmithia morbida]|uniref:Myb-like DNA-binding domain n=1 Tax=Geosmithia morbida TaxID=1094350 RepID=A0A9P4YZR2_9HYPO|nr:Myb-like DNA-binding domain [Geosmithia morbida]KAF4124618.1 Myb-like DNA-binding domain [Geosmithia morbida]